MDKPCLIDGCPNTARTRGWCAMHYRRWQRTGDPETAGRKRSSAPRPKCSIDGCESDVLSRSWCVRHYNRWLAHGDPVVMPPRAKPSPPPPKLPCKVEGCERTSALRGWCFRHYHRWKRLGDPEAGGPQRNPQIGPCVIGGCEEPAVARGWCGRHYQRWQAYGDPEAPLRRARNGQSTKRWTNHDGYVLIRLQGKSVLEHRKVMEEKLGRSLLPGETVHHMNGVRTDNRPENLELWVGTRPGQRVADLIAFVVGRYRAEVEAALD
jgi:hypothetical protein